MGVSRRLLVLFALMAVLFTSFEVRAASSTFNGLFFKPATGRNPYLMLHSSDTLHALQFNVADFMSYGYRPLELRQGTKRLRGIIDQSLVSHFTAAFAPLEFLQLGVDFPLVLINKFESPENTTSVGTTNEFDMGDLRFEIKGRVLDPSKYYLGIAIVPFVTVPTGKDAHYVGDPGVTAGARLAVDGRVHDRILLTMNLGYLGGKKVVLRNVEFQNRFLIGGGTSVFLNKGINVFGEINSQTDFSNFFTDRDVNPTEVMLGAKWDVLDTGVSVQAGGGTCLVCGVMGAKARGVLAVKYRFNPPKYQQLDRAQDLRYKALFKKKITAAEFYELKMNCPDHPAQFQAGVHDAACPKYYELREVADLVLRCPSDPSLYNPGVHDAACPKVFELKDSFSPTEIKSIYSLGVSEMRLRCPDSPEEFRHGVHDSACPKYYSLKEAVDLAETCPANPADYQSGLYDASCPKFYMLRDDYGQDQWATIVKLARLDSDSDGINDYLDRCPKIPEDVNGIADKDGCPETGPGAVSGGEVHTLQPVYFGFNSSRLTPKAKQGLDQVIKTIDETPWISRIMIAGHADARGSKNANLWISKKRAKVVMNYMKSHGLRSGIELSDVGYGSDKPAFTNETEKGRALNRRVVFNVPQYRYRDYKPGKNGEPPSAFAEPAEKDVSPKPIGSAPPPSRWGN